MLQKTFTATRGLPPLRQKVPHPTCPVGSEPEPQPGVRGMHFWIRAAEKAWPMHDHLTSAGSAGLVPLDFAGTGRGGPPE